MELSQRSHGHQTRCKSAHNLALVAELGADGNMEDTPTTDLWTDAVAVYGKLDEAKEGEAGNKLMRIVLVDDAASAMGRWKFHAQVVHNIHVESLGDFAEARTTAVQRFPIKCFRQNKAVMYNSQPGAGIYLCYYWNIETLSDLSERYMNQRLTKDDQRVIRACQLCKGSINPFKNEF
jgi:hypothetical protein